MPEGEYPTHLITGSFHRGSYETVKNEVYLIGEMLNQRGLEVTRHKIEAMINNEAVPETDEEAHKMPSDQYFEFHVKVRREGGDDSSELEGLCDEFNVHLSRSASNRIGSEEQRFITARYYRVGRRTALAAWNLLLDAFRGKKYRLSNQIREYTVFDDNLDMDRGWAFTSPCQDCEQECLFEV